MKANKKSSNTLRTFLYDTCFCALISLVITLIVTLLFSLAITNLKRHEIFYPTVSVVIQCLTAFLAGRIMATKHPHSILILGVLEGIIISVTGNHILLGLP